MTVRELVEKLNQMPADAQVLVKDEGDDVADLTSVELVPDVDDYRCQSLDTVVEGEVVVLLMGLAESGLK